MQADFDLTEKEKCCHRMANGSPSAPIGIRSGRDMVTAPAGSMWDGTGLKRVTGSSVCSGSPKWSLDSKQIVFYEMPVETTWDARVFGLSARATSQIVSISLESGKRTEQTSGPGLKLQFQFLPNEYATKAGKNQGIAYTNGKGTSPGNLRSPAWSPDGTQVIY